MKYPYLLSIIFISSILAACSQANNNSEQTPTEQPTTAPTNKINIYTSTNVWGSIAKAIGGEQVNVISAVNKPTQDPHEYQATANDKLNISQSTLVLVNGGGYDDWAISLAKATTPTPTMINAVKLSGLDDTDHHDEHEHHHHEHKHEHDHDHTHHDHHSHHHKHHHDFNEHVFYSLETAKQVAQAVANHLETVDKNHQGKYAQNANDFIQKIDQLKTKAQAIGQNRTINVLYTEPVLDYLLQDMKVNNITPKEFIQQSDSETGVSVKILNDTKKLLSEKKADILVLNAQTEDDIAKVLLQTAKDANIPVVEVYETFPENIQNYDEFIEKTLTDFSNKLQDNAKK